MVILKRGAFYTAIIFGNLFNSSPDPFLLSFLSSFLSPPCLLPTSYLPPIYLLPASYLPLSYLLPTSFLPPTCLLPTSFPPPSCLLPTPFLPPTCLLPASSPLFRLALSFDLTYVVTVFYMNLLNSSDLSTRVLLTALLDRNYSVTV